MKTTRGLADYTRGPHPVLTIGNFDGQHKGHLELLQAVVGRAAEVGGMALVLTFDPHPLTVLKPDLLLRFLTSAEDKLARFREVGIHEVVLIEFDKALASLSPEEFVFQILRDRLGVRDLFVGEDFAFGKDRAGTMSDLAQWAPRAGFRVHAVPAVRIDGEVVSSSRIRRLLQAGEVQAAARCLGRHYALAGAVVRGDQRGQTLGWPTANLRLPDDRVIPADGVYAAIARHRGQRFDAVAYIGTRPTFGGGERLIEVYLLDEEIDLYGEDLRVEFVQRLRSDLAFATADELAIRIRHDVVLAKESLRSAAKTLTGT